MYKYICDCLILLSRRYFIGFDFLFVLQKNNGNIINLLSSRNRI